MTYVPKSATTPTKLVEPHFDFIDTYMEYTENSECPKAYHLWCCLSLLAAAAGRNIRFKFGHDVIYPNLFVLLVGLPATRKSSAIRVCRQLLAGVGYMSFGPEKTSREKFLCDLEAGYDTVNVAQNPKVMEAALDIVPPKLGEQLASLLDAPMGLDEKTSEVYLCLSEYADFVGQNNTAFATTLTNLYDNPLVYPERLKQSKSVLVERPCVNILGGLTPTHFATHLPPELMGQGFISRLILINGIPTKRKIAFPEPPDTKKQFILQEQLKAFRKVKGEFKLADDARAAMTEIYEEYIPIPDVRFQSYTGRRFTHLLKISMLCALARMSMTIQLEDVMRAQTYLVMAEEEMPSALGEYGDSKYAAASQKVMELLLEAPAGMLPREIFPRVSTHISNIKELNAVITTLEQAQRILIKEGIITVNHKPHERNVMYTDKETFWPYEEF